MSVSIPPNAAPLKKCRDDRGDADADYLRGIAATQKYFFEMLDVLAEQDRQLSDHERRRERIRHHANDSMIAPTCQKRAADRHRNSEDGRCRKCEAMHVSPKCERIEEREHRQNQKTRLPGRDMPAAKDSATHETHLDREIPRRAHTRLWIPIRPPRDFPCKKAPPPPDTT